MKRIAVLIVSLFLSPSALALALICKTPEGASAPFVAAFTRVETIASAEAYLIFTRDDGPVIYKGACETDPDADEPLYRCEVPAVPGFAFQVVLGTPGDVTWFAHVTPVAEGLKGNPVHLSCAEHKACTGDEVCAASD